MRDAWVLGSPFKHILLRVELGTGNNVSTYQCENHLSEGVLKSEYVCCESGWKFMDLGCIEWEVLGLQGGDELHSVKVRVHWEKLPEVAHFVPEASWWRTWHMTKSPSWGYAIIILIVSKLPGEVFSGETPTVEVDGDRQRSQLVNHLEEAKSILWLYILWSRKRGIYIIGSTSKQPTFLPTFFQLKGQGLFYGGAPLPNSSALRI